MTNVALLGFALGVAAGISALLLFASIGIENVRPGGRSKLLAGLAFSLPAVALVAYVENADHPVDTVQFMPMAPAGADSATAQAEDWSSISHVYSGDAAADVGADVAAGAAMPARNPHTVEEMTAVTAREPGNVGAWLALAGAQRRDRDFVAAAASYQRALRLDGRNADAWADYADALASSGDRRLAGAPAEAIARALKLNARHPKALWLQASLDLELRRYGDALGRWQALRAVLPAGSPDIPIVDANIAEARQLAGRGTGGG